MKNWVQPKCLNSSKSVKTGFEWLTIFQRSRPSDRKLLLAVVVCFCLIRIIRHVGIRSVVFFVLHGAKFGSGNFTTEKNLDRVGSDPVASKKIRIRSDKVKPCKSNVRIGLGWVNPGQNRV